MTATATESIRITVNGQPRELPAGASVDSLLTLLGVRRELVAVEVNQRLVRRADHPTRELQEGDHVEVVEFVGGG